MRWRTEYNEQVLKELARLDKVDAKMILSSIQEFANHFSPEYEKSLMFRSCGICTTMRVVESADIFISD